jgi:glyceraldehyde-3-phosphate dehydrogenase (EC 1.2.1.12)
VARVKVAVNGYGTIGKRVADAIKLQPDMELVGVAKTSPNYEAFTAVKKGYKLYVPKKMQPNLRKQGYKLMDT